MMRDEFEILTNKVLQGDLTPVFYDLVKDSPFVLDLLRYVDKEEKGVYKNRHSRVANNEGDGRITFESWLADNVQSI